MGLFGKKKDFWDEVEEKSSGQTPYSAEEEELYEADDVYEDDGKFHPTKSKGVKIFFRLLMLVSTVVAVLAGTIFLAHAGSGSSAEKSDYFKSRFFAEAYNEDMNDLFSILTEMEKTSTDVSKVSESSKKEMTALYLPEAGNLAYAIYDGSGREVLTSGADAVPKIEASHNFVKLDTTNGRFNISTGVVNNGFDQTGWKKKMQSLQGEYTLYAAVDDNLAVSGDIISDYYDLFAKTAAYSQTAMIVMIAALIIFLISLIFNIVATGNVRGYNGIKLSIFDRVPTEIAVMIMIALSAAAIIGFRYANSAFDGNKRTLICGAALLLAYIFIVRAYFSIVRRVKAGRFTRNMIFYRIFYVIGLLPSILKVIVMLIALVVINGAMIVAMFSLDSFTINNIPLVYVIVPFLFVMEIISFIAWIIRGSGEEDDDDDEEEDERPVKRQVPVQVPVTEEKPAQPAPVMPVEEDDQPVFEEVPAMDTKPSVMGETIIAAPIVEEAPAEEVEVPVQFTEAEAETETTEDTFDDPVLSEAVVAEIQKAEEEAPAEPEAETAEKTEMLPADEIETQLTAPAAADTATAFDFVQLNKDIRKLHRANLRTRGIAVTMRVPENPVILEMNKEDMWKVISAIYDNLERFTENDSRVYVEMYVKDGKVIYLVKNAVKADDIEAACEAVKDPAKLTGGLETAKAIIEKNNGRLVVAMDEGSNIFKTGIMISVSQN